MKVDSTTRQAHAMAGVGSSDTHESASRTARHSERVPGLIADGPVGRAIHGLATVDRVMADILRSIADAGPVDGLPAARLISLAARATGWDIAYLRRMTDTLAAMPGVWAAFDRGEVSWSQLRGICGAAKGLLVADRQELDRRLSGAITQNGTAEPDRLVEVADDLAGRLDEAAEQRRDRTQAACNQIRFEPRLFGGMRFFGELDDELSAWMLAAVYGAADRPVADDAARPVDADGKPIPRSWLAPTGRSAQLAEALGRVCVDWLAGHTSSDTHMAPGPDNEGGDGGQNSDRGWNDKGGRPGPADDGATDDGATDDGATDDGATGNGAPDDGPADDGATGNEAADDGATDGDGSDHEVAGEQTAQDGSNVAPDAGQDGASQSSTGRAARPTALVVVDITDLVPADQRGPGGGVPAATARMLWQLAGGRQRLSTARVHAMTCDAVHVPVLTDGDIPIAVGDAYDPISIAVRRAAAVRDQGCRFPGCQRPIEQTDLHHVVWREHGRPTELSNLVSLCRGCHNLAHQHGWQMTLYDDGRLTVSRGRYRFTSRPRLRPPPPEGPPQSTPEPPGSGPPSNQADLDRVLTAGPRQQSTVPLPF